MELALRDAPEAQSSVFRAGRNISAVCCWALSNSLAWTKSAGRNLALLGISGKAVPKGRRTWLPAVVPQLPLGGQGVRHRWVGRVAISSLGWPPRAPMQLYVLVKAGPGTETRSCKALFRQRGCEPPDFCSALQTGESIRMRAQALRCLPRLLDQSCLENKSSS